jgi:hypothetical protein
MPLAGQMGLNFDEVKHPRDHKGVSSGGRFTAKPPASGHAAWASRRHKHGDHPTSFLSGHSSNPVREAAKQNPGLGLLITPHTQSYIGHIADYSHIALDNGVYSEFTGSSPFSHNKFMDMLHRVAAVPGAKEKTQFVVAPDRVGDWQGTIERSRPYFAQIRKLGFPVAFAAQDGIEDHMDQIPWDDFDVLFIGGSTPWKLGFDPKGEYKNHFRPTDDELRKSGMLPNHIKLQKEAKRRGKRIHMGRVNSHKRMVDMAHGGLQADTADGNYIGVAPDQNLPDVLNWLGNTGGDQFKSTSEAVQSYARAPLAGQMGFKFDESKHPRGKGPKVGGQFVAGDHGASHTFPEAGGRYGFTAEVTGRNDKGHVEMKSEQGTATVPQESMQHFYSDMTGDVSYLKQHGSSGHAAVDNVIHGGGEFIGRGDDSVVWKSGDKVVKSGTTMPYHPMSGQWAHGLPHKAVERAQQQNDMSEEMRAAGVKGIPKQETVRHGDRMFTVREHLDIPDKLTEKQLLQARNHLKTMHDAGYAVNDQMQFGVGADGDVYHFDLGKADKTTKKNYHSGETDDASDDRKRMRDLFDKSDVRYDPPMHEIERDMGQVLRSIKLRGGMDNLPDGHSLRKQFKELEGPMYRDKHPWVGYLEGFSFGMDDAEIKEHGHDVPAGVFDDEPKTEHTPLTFAGGFSVHGKHPAELAGQMVRGSDVNKQQRSAYVNEAGGRNEHSSRSTPADAGSHEVGTWKVDNDFEGNHGRFIEQLQELDPHTLELPEGDYANQPKHNPEGRRDDAVRYAEWIKQGHQAPEISVNETDAGGLRVTDGHRRVAAAKMAGVPIRAWISPNVPIPGMKTPDGKPIYTGLTDRLAGFTWQDKQKEPDTVKSATDAYARAPLPNQMGFNFDEQKHPRETTSHDTKRAGEFAPKQQAPVQKPKTQKAVPEKTAAPNEPDGSTVEVRPGQGVLDKAGDGYYFIASGKKNARHTLRHHFLEFVSDNYGGTVRERDHHVDTLTSDYKTAVAKAKRGVAMLHGTVLYSNEFKLDGSGDRRDPDVYKFGKYEGKKIADVDDPAYVQWSWMQPWFWNSPKYKRFRQELREAGQGPIPETEKIYKLEEQQKAAEDKERKTAGNATAADLYYNTTAYPDTPEDFKKRDTAKFEKGVDWFHDKSNYQNNHHKTDKIELIRRMVMQCDDKIGIANYKGADDADPDPFWLGVRESATFLKEDIQKQSPDQKSVRIQARIDKLTEKRAAIIEKYSRSLAVAVDAYAAPLPNQMGFSFDEQQHPREPTGKTEGGRFAKKAAEPYKGPKRGKSGLKFDFDKPIKGPSGAELFAYEWRHYLVEEPDESGEWMVTKRISDWEQAESSGHTGRNIVHLWDVTDQQGKHQTLSLESALRELGYIDDTTGQNVRTFASAVMKKAKLQMALEKAGGTNANLQRQIASVDERIAVLNRVANDDDNNPTGRRSWMKRAEKAQHVLKQHSEPAEEWQKKENARDFMAERSDWLRGQWAIQRELERLTRGYNGDDSDRRLTNWFRSNHGDIQKAVQKAEAWIEKNHQHGSDINAAESHGDTDDIVRKMARVTAKRSDANTKYNLTNRQLAYSYFAESPDGKVVRVDGSDKRDSEFFGGRGFHRVGDVLPDTSHDHGRRTLRPAEGEPLPVKSDQYSMSGSVTRYARAQHHSAQGLRAYEQFIEELIS